LVEKIGKKDGRRSQTAKDPDLQLEKNVEEGYPLAYRPGGRMKKMLKHAHSAWTKGITGSSKTGS
jgi:hypothetical protein